MLETCSFETERLRAGEWHSLAAESPRQLEDVVASMLTEPVTRALPEAWRGSYSLDRARSWIEERDAEGTTLLVVEKATSDSIGLIILSAIPAESSGAGADVRLGYLLAEQSWGKGYASELVEGLVAWCRAQPSIASLTGGVESDNAASRRVLEKNGFELLEDRGEEQLFRASL